MLSWCAAALGKPNAMLSQEALDEKDANRTGGGEILQNYGSLSNKSNSRSRRSLQQLTNEQNVTSSGDSPKVRRLPSFGGDSPKTLRLASLGARSVHSDLFDTGIEANGVAAKRGMVLPFQPLAIAFHHINYFIDMPPVSGFLILIPLAVWAFLLLWFVTVHTFRVKPFGVPAIFF